MVIPFAQLDAAAKQAEQGEGAHGRRVVKLLSDDGDKPDLWSGDYGSAPVCAAESSGYILSDGSAVLL